MPANDDVLHTQGHHRVLDGRGHTAHHLAVGWHHVAHVAVDEQIAGRALRNQFRHHPRIRAGDDHRARALCCGELFEQFFLLREDITAKAFEALDDALQRLFGTFPTCAPHQGNGLMLVRHV